MYWVFRVRVHQRPRVHARVLQVFDRQAIQLDSFTAHRMNDCVDIRIQADIGTCDGARLEALLLHLEDVVSVEADCLPHLKAEPSCAD